MLALSCGPTAAECFRDTDCKGSRLCLSGACVDPQGAGGGNGGTGGSTGGVGGGMSTGTGGGTQTSEYGTCCLNNTFYSCGTQAAFTQCLGFDIEACEAACSPSDIDCFFDCQDRALNGNHDPSACTRDASRDGTCGTTTETCNDIRGAACTLSSQCSSNNCTSGYCRARSLGSACSLSSQCDSNNCTSGCCRGTSTGSACSLSSQCTSNNCTGGYCRGNAYGDQCTLSSQCTSNNCTGGRCQ